MRRYSEEGWKDKNNKWNDQKNKKWKDKTWSEKKKWNDMNNKDNTHLNKNTNKVGRCRLNRKNPC